MKHVVVMVADQTITFLTKSGGETTIHANAALFDSEDDAIKAGDALGLFTEDRADAWVEDVADVAEFCARPDTW